ncbi:hypothetical protein [Dactylosporangium sp. NPDC005555]|uniref:hypothetical protein n=1 Tax=Dactylosporangium sp. NPDC005555 TaxID=3154889 RepID=UPI0033B5F901
MPTLTGSRQTGHANRSMISVMRRGPTGSTPDTSAVATTWSKELIVQIRRILAALGATAVIMTINACGGDEPTPAAGNGGGLSYDKVASLTNERLMKDPDCPIGKWDDNSTGLDEAFRSDGKFFKQFDCYKTADASLPHRVQQAIYVEFTNAERAKAYAQEQSILYPTLLVGSTVVVAGSGLEATDMKAYLSAVQAVAGGAGEILG